MSDAVIAAVVYGALALHLIVLLTLAIGGRDQKAPFVVNIVVAGVLLPAMLTAPPTFRLPVDWQIVGGLIAEVAVTGLAIAALKGARLARLASMMVFAAHLLLCCAATLFILTFSIDRLF